MSRTLRSSRSALVSVGFALALAGTSGCSTAGPDGGPAAVPTGSTDASASFTAPGEQRFPDVVAVEIRRAGEDAYDLSVTLSSPYDTPERYVDEVTVEGHDQANGYGGGTFAVEVPRGPA